MSNQKASSARRTNKLASMPTTPSTPRLKQKSTRVNACYTPSSLYRNIGSSSTHKVTKAETSTPSSTNMEVSNLTVAVRVRPSLNEEDAASNLLIEDSEVSLTVRNANSSDCGAMRVTHSFAYDRVYNSSDPKDSNYANQQMVFTGTAQPLLDWAFEGYNACLFAYGQTGSGKSYSMIGVETPETGHLENCSSGLHSEAGIIPRLCYDLFRRVDCMKDVLHAEVEISYFEIYNEKIYDLLRSAGNADATSVYDCNINGGHTAPQTPTQRPALKVREHPLWGPYIVDLSAHPVDSYKALQNWLTLGNSNRATAATIMNDKSSRSHSILNIILTLTELAGGEPKAERQARRSKISLVDLAGSERINASTSTGDRIREGVSINKSLLTLGKVIAALSDAKCGSAGSTFIPYRESVLTWLLRENLGGNSKTAMLATISPASTHTDETLATLRYACQARRIVNRVHINESPHDKLIRELRTEIDRLKTLHNEYNRQKRLSGNLTPKSAARLKDGASAAVAVAVDDNEVETLRQQLHDREKELLRAQRTWTERLLESEHQQKSEIHMLKRKGLALELSAAEKQACLINLTADPILSGIMFYLLPTGKVRIGRPRARLSSAQSKLDIVLDGPLVAHNHCVIENVQGILHVTQENEQFETYLNGELVRERMRVYHGDRLVIGGMHYFRISNPFCSRSRAGSRAQVVDFQYAYKEILRKQEEKLRHELEREKTEALSRIELERMQNERNFKERLQELELEQLKFKCNREILESERNAYQADAGSQSSSSTPNATSFKSTIFEDISTILQNPSKESLHKTQLMVKEATQRCRDLGVNFDFRQSKVVDEFGIFRTVILILDKANNLKAEWPNARLSVWLDIVRDAENLDPNNLFTAVDIDWEPFSHDDGNFDSYESPNTSGISLNLSVVKDSILKQKNGHLYSASRLASPNGSSATKTMSPQLQLRTRKLLTYNDESPCLRSPAIHNFNEKAAALVGDLQKSTIRLRKLCESNKRNNGGNFQVDSPAATKMCKSIEQLEMILADMHLSLKDVVNVDAATKTHKSVRFLVD